MSDGAAEKLARENRMAPSALLGAGSLVLTLDQGDARTTYQGVVPLEGATLAACAENYFRVSEQTDTRLRLAVGEVFAGEAPGAWRGGGVLLQRLASDAARGDTEEDWSRASILFDTLTDEELIDPSLDANRLLFRLFHEDGVRMSEPAALVDRCSCDEQRLGAVMRQFPADEIADLIEPDGFIHARCQFCARTYRMLPSAGSAA